MWNLFLTQGLDGVPQSEGGVTGTELVPLDQSRYKNSLSVVPLLSVEFWWWGHNNDNINNNIKVYIALVQNIVGDEDGWQGTNKCDKQMNKLQFGYFMLRWKETLCEQECLRLCLKEFGYVPLYLKSILQLKHNVM